MKLILIAALTKNKRGIGNQGKLPWHISEDLKRFKRLTAGHTVLMGRKTFESIGKPLTNRRNVVLSSRTLQGVETFSSLNEALGALQGEEQVFVIGGGEVFAQLLEQADELRLTIVDQDVDGDAYFPPYRHLVEKRFRLVHREEHNGYAFEDYVKIEER